MDRCFVLDMVNAHAQILSRRHPGLGWLRKYVDRREEVLASIPAPRKDVKQLFIKMIYGGHWRSWCQEHAVHPTKLPDLVEAFRLEMQEAREADARNHPELHKQLVTDEPAGQKSSSNMRSTRKRSAESWTASPTPWNDWAEEL